MIRLEDGDMLQVIPRLVAEGVVCDAVVTDPPYHLTSGNHYLDGAAYKRRPGDRGQKGGPRSGFMGQQWDGGDIAFRPETWATVATILRPGAFVVAFGGTRTVHRMACAIEDAGFVIQDSLMWLYATGFPKRRDMLKPAFEPIVLAYKPGGKRTMQVDECRIHGPDARGGDYTVTRLKPGATLVKIGGNWRPEEGGTIYHGSTPPGRWPANVCHDGSDEVAAGFPDITSTAGNPRRSHAPAGTGWRNCHTGAEYNDTGSAARFFFSAKAGSEDRWGSRHPTVKPVDLIAWLVKLVTPPGGTFLDPFAGSGTAAVAALQTGRNAILIEREPQYLADIQERIAYYEGGGAHSVQAKNRNRQTDAGPLFAAAPLTPEEDADDSLRSYEAAMRAIGERVKAGAPVPEFLLRKT